MHMTTSEKFSFMACCGRYRAGAMLGGDRAVVVELDDLHDAVRRGVEAEAAEHALVEVLLDQLERAVCGLRVDVDRARLGQLLRKPRVGRRCVVDFDCDEETVLPHAWLLSAIFALTRSGISSIRCTTGMPAASSRAIFSVAESSLPSTIVPACPKDIPCISSSSMNLPAMNATIGRRESFSLTHCDNPASMRPPGSV